jgi:hypothetical protein
MTWQQNYSRRKFINKEGEGGVFNPCSDKQDETQRQMFVFNSKQFMFLENNGCG